MRTSERDQQAAIAQAELCVLLDRFQREHKLTTAEMLQAVTSWQGTCLKFMVRSEREARLCHPGSRRRWSPGG